MPLIEIDDVELAALRNNKKVLDTLGGNAKTRQRLLGLIKEVAPGTAIPEIDAAAPVLEVVKGLNDRFDEFDKRMKERDADDIKTKSQREIDDSITRGRTMLRQRGYTEDGVEQVEKLMQQRGLIDYEAAAALFEKNEPKDEAVMPTDYARGWDFASPADNDEDHKLLLKDPAAFARKETNKFLRELKTANGRR